MSELELEIRDPMHAPAKPTHYRVVAISLYTKDLERCESLVAELKRRGVPHANRSELIRLALEQFDPDKVKR